MEPDKRILIAPLDWGLGHATRCIPIIQGFRSRGCEVVIASSGSSLAYLKKEFHDLKFYELPDYKPEYSLDSDSMVLKMLSQLPKFVKTIEAEHAAINKIIRKENIDLLISDNRYGSYSREIKSIFVTHQLNILMPPKWKWIEKSVNRFNHNQIRKFSECWIPAPDSTVIPSLLASPETIEKKYISYLSRMNLKATNIKYDVIAIMSGPPPQRQMLTDIIREQFKLSELKTLLVEGAVSDDSKVSVNRIHAEANFLLSTELNEAINQSDLVIARSGYSMIMDLAKLKKRAIFIPTPGQTEQEYIAQQLMKNKVAFSTSQSKFDLKEAMKEADKFSGFVKFAYDESLLDQAIDSVL